MENSQLHSRSSLLRRLSLIGFLGLFWIFVPPCSPHAAQPIGQSVSVGGTVLGSMVAIETSDAPDSTAGAHQFDFAVNLDFEWQLHERLVVFVQGQGGPGDGPFGNPGPGLEITDIGIAFEVYERAVELTFGSFDTPFGLTTYRLTNNADATANPLILNSLMYSAFTESPTGTLNTLGIKGSYLSDVFEVHAAITNGTDESADNADGNYELVATAAVHLPVEFDLTVAGAAIYSDDTSPNHATGFGSQLTGFLGELFISPVEIIEFSTYAGYLEYDDNTPVTEDGVVTLHAEGVLRQPMWHLAIRASGWLPGADISGGEAVSTAMPLPGLSSYTPVVQDVWRYQVGGTLQVLPNVWLMAEGFYDKYEMDTGDINTDTFGAIASVQVMM